MEWTDDGVILRVRPHGETSAIVELLTAGKGRCAGLVRGGRSRRMRGVLQPGNAVRATWRARLEDHLGNFTIEAAQSLPAEVLDDRLSLAGLNASCALLCLAAPEREAHPKLYDAFSTLIAHFDDPAVWPALMARFEAGLLSEVGYGLDLGRCAATGRTESLAYVSPKTGRAVSAEAGEPYKDKLFTLPPILRGESRIESGDIERAFNLTGYFLERWLLWPADKQLPEPRADMLDKLRAAGRL